MIKKTVNEAGAVCLLDGENVIATIHAAIDHESDAVKFEISGALRNDVQVYLKIELQFFCAVNISALEVNCKNITAISPSCFGELLEAKIKMTNKNANVIFLDKSDCITKMEKNLGKIL